MLVDERRNIIAHVENEPDGDEARDAVKIYLQEITNNVSVEKSHCDLVRFVRTSVLKSTTRAKSQQKGMSNNQMTKDSGAVFSSVWHWASLVIRHLVFVICCWTS